MSAGDRPARVVEDGGRQHWRWGRGEVGRGMVWNGDSEESVKHSSRSKEMEAMGQGTQT